MPPPDAPAARGSRRDGRARWAVPAATSAVTAAVTAGAVFGTAAALDGRDGGPHRAPSAAGRPAATAPAATAPAAPGTLFTKVASVCPLVDPATARRLAPDPEIEMTPAESGAEAACEWSSQARSHPGQLRSVRVSVGVYTAADGVAGAQAARGAYEVESETAGDAGGGPTVQDGTTFRPLSVRRLPGLGDKAFASAEQQTGRYGGTTSVTVVVLLRNAVVKVAFQGSDNPRGAPSTTTVPIDPAPFRPVVEQAAREAVTALTRCVDCRI
ncbi:hypothetical protein [Actinomadura parmotrematis]|uniref:DUF3558 domain-containing protein n=1 Tax=Actinomadura parmotrematis TaxID=2864039 RepID=A0ABS7FZZ6_9ACTN|nr:hypothetical protein [Actinomadura parmotrematis]MBW8485831.1 hypothetical protein [Actinomadura parmotrematis]